MNSPFKPAKELCPSCDEYTMPEEWAKCIEDRRKLVEALRGVVEAYTVTDGKAGKNPAERSAIREQGRNLLQSLGEG